MATVDVERTDTGFIARNPRGGEIAVADNTNGTDFTPVELLLAAVGGCNVVTVEPLTAKRGHQLIRLGMTVEAEKIEPNLLGPVTVTYHVQLPADDPKAKEVFEAVAHRVHQKSCTVSRSLAEGVPVDINL